MGRNFHSYAGWHSQERVSTSTPLAMKSLLHVYAYHISDNLINEQLATSYPLRSNEIARMIAGSDRVWKQFCSYIHVVANISLSMEFGSEVGLIVL